MTDIESKCRKLESFELEQRSCARFEQAGQEEAASCAAPSCAAAEGPPPDAPPPDLEPACSARAPGRAQLILEEVARVRFSHRRRFEDRHVIYHVSNDTLGHRSLLRPCPELHAVIAGLFRKHGRNLGIQIFYRQFRPDGFDIILAAPECEGCAASEPGAEDDEPPGIHTIAGFMERFTSELALAVQRITGHREKVFPRPYQRSMIFRAEMCEVALKNIVRKLIRCALVRHPRSLPGINDFCYLAGEEDFVRGEEAAGSPTGEPHGESDDDEEYAPLELYELPIWPELTDPQARAERFRKLVDEACAEVPFCKRKAYGKGELRRLNPHRCHVRARRWILPEVLEHDEELRESICKDIALANTIYSEEYRDHIQQRPSCYPAGMLAPSSTRRCPGGMSGCGITLPPIGNRVCDALRNRVHRTVRAVP